MNSPVPARQTTKPSTGWRFGFSGTNGFSRRSVLLAVVAIALVVATLTFAQRRGNWGGWGGGGRGRYNDSYQTPREIAQHGAATPTWTNAPGFESDVFTFVRVKRERGYGSGGDWSTDTPDSDLNLSFRLQQMTS